MRSRILSLGLDLAEGRLTSKSLIEKTIANAKAVNSQLGNVNLFINEEASIRAAEAIDAALARSDENQSISRTLLTGIPTAIKDNFTMKNIITTAGSRYLEKFESPYNSAVVDILERSQAIVCLKSNMDEFGMGSSNLNSAYGPCINPWSKSNALCAGGSSGASAVSVASGLVPFAIGSDTGGSVRLPASFCGIVGLKPSYGTISRYGLISYASSLDTPGILTSSVIDAAIVLDYLAEHDSRDPTSTHHIRNRKLSQKKVLPTLFDYPLSSSDVQPSLASTTPDFLHRLQKANSSPRSLQGVTIGVPIEFNVEELDNQSRLRFESSLQEFQQAGASIKLLSLPALKLALPCYYLLACAEASSNLARYDGVRYGQRSSSLGSNQESIQASVSELHRMIARTRGEYLGSEVIKRILTGTFVLSKDSYEEYYGRASLIRRYIRQEVQQVFRSGVDILVSPTSPVLPYPINQPPYSADMMLNDFYTVVANLAGMPAINLPVDVVQRGQDYLPIGIQLMADAHDEVSLIRVAHCLESIVDFSSKIPSHVNRCG
jgi:aspartyl-tRNA(Asn)/glutamyl-tRNA(Gln) amidotransferase subunit A